MPRVDVVRTYLELVERRQLRAVALPASDVRVVRLAPDAVEDYRHLYRAIGERWHWVDRLAWSDEVLRAHLASPDIAVWRLEVDDDPAGWFELKRDVGGDVEIAYFGLVPAFIGRGLGGALLTRAVEEAWTFGGRRVWLHTCTLDSPRALPNYRARGFKEFRTERYVADV
jgi:GNAT superfamily N-acetyltransferase